MLSKNRIGMSMSYKRFCKVFDTFEPMFKVDEDSEKMRIRFWAEGGKDMTYAGLWEGYDLCRADGIYEPDDYGYLR